MKARDIRDLTLDEVLQKKQEVEKEHFNLKLRQATRQIDNPLRVRILRRDLARIKTILKEHETKLRPLAEGTPQAIDRQADDEK